jgi:hypothetical protein
MKRRRENEKHWPKKFEQMRVSQNSQLRIVSAFLGWSPKGQTRLFMRY